MELKCITPPLGEPLSLAEVKLHLRVDHDHEDSLIEGLITAAREYVELNIGGCLPEQVRGAYLDSWPIAPLRLPWGPVIGIESVKYLDGDGAEHEADAGSYYLTAGGEIALLPGQAWPKSSLKGKGAIEIAYSAGYPPEVTTIPGETPEPSDEDPDPKPLPDTEVTDYGGNVPQGLRQAMLLLIGQWYELREGASGEKYVVRAVPYGVRQLLAPYREIVL